MSLLGALALHAYSLRAPFFADDYLFLDQVRDRSLPAALTSPDPIGKRRIDPELEMATPARRG